ncbi:transglutaminase domain-containing protein [Pseudomonadota bacterium]
MVFHMRVVRTLLVIWVITQLSACIMTPDKKSTLGSIDVSPTMLLESSPLGEGTENLDLAQVDVLEMTPDMIEFVDSYMEGSTNRYRRMQRLVYAIIGDGNFELAYDDKTRTASETFREARGNCLSFTNLFIAMARHLEIHAEYQEVDIPPDWSLAGDAFFFSQHINVLVDLGVGIQRVVDFNIYDFQATYDRRTISDARARAHYFSNIGVEHMMHGETSLAYANFRQALREDIRFSPAWINMGILHRRERYPNYAETSYKQALEIYQFNLIAMSNLANLYEEEGKTEWAEQYKDRVQLHRMSNPYYRYAKANTAFMDGDYKAAIDNLEYAIEMVDDEDRFYFLLSLSYLMSGDKEESTRWMKKAEEVAKQNESREKYSHKLDLLISQGQTKK